jgi:colanic acid/amylovoran biosynthesis glycosyltransferase
MSPPSKPKVVIFSDHLLYTSETFIRAQAMALSEYEPVFAGSRFIGGLELPRESTHVINGGGLSGLANEVVFKLSGVAPGLTRRLRKARPVLLHAHHGPNGLRALRLAKSIGVPLVVTFHGSDVTVTKLQHHPNASLAHRRFLSKRITMQQQGALFVAVSGFIRKKLLELGFPDERIRVQYTGVDTTMFQADGRLREPVILFVGRLVKRKGAEYLIQAAAEVQKEFSQVEVVIIGEGPLRADLEARAKQSLQRYRFLGAQSHGEVCEWMNRAAVFCAPSITLPSGESEAFGMVYAEAMAMALPVVAFDSGGIAEVVADGETGFLAAEKDWRSLAGRLLELFRDERLRTELGAAGRSRVLRHFDLVKCTKGLETAYGNVVAKGAITQSPKASTPDTCVA